MKTKIFFLLFIFFNVLVFQAYATDSRKLLIPGESFKNDNQKRFEIENFKKSGVSPREWRRKKCYRDVVFEVFWNSKLCPADGPMCLHSYNVEELHMFKKYYDYLLQISELCADGYLIDNNDRKFFKNSTQKDVDRFVIYVKETKKKLLNYDNLQDSNFKVKEKNEKIINTKRRNEGAHGAVPPPKKLEDEILSEKSVSDKEQKLREEERNLEIRKELLQDEKRILEQKRILRDLEKSIKEAENLIQKKKNSLE